MIGTINRLDQSYPNLFHLPILSISAIWFFIPFILVGLWLDGSILVGWMAYKALLVLFIPHLLFYGFYGITVLGFLIWEKDWLNFCYGDMMTDGGDAVLIIVMMAVVFVQGMLLLSYASQDFTPHAELYVMQLQYYSPEPKVIPSLFGTVAAASVWALVQATLEGDYKAITMGNITSNGLQDYSSETMSHHLGYGDPQFAVEQWREDDIPVHVEYRRFDDRVHKRGRQNHEAWHDDPSTIGKVSHFNEYWRTLTSLQCSYSQTWPYAFPSTYNKTPAIRNQTVMPYDFDENHELEDRNWEWYRDTHRGMHNLQTTMLLPVDFVNASSVPQCPHPFDDYVGQRPMWGLTCLYSYNLTRVDYKGIPLPHIFMVFSPCFIFARLL